MQMLLLYPILGMKATINNTWFHISREHLKSEPILNSGPLVRVDFNTWMVYILPLSAIKTKHEERNVNVSILKTWKWNKCFKMNNVNKQPLFLSVTGESLIYTLERKISCDSLVHTSKKKVLFTQNDIIGKYLHLPWDLDRRELWVSCQC